MSKSLKDEVRVVMQRLAEVSEMALDSRRKAPEVFSELESKLGEREARRIARTMILHLDALLNGDVRI